jgi:hypothetical protein
MSITQETGNPVVVIRGGQDAEPDYFIYSWDDRTQQVTRAAAAADDDAPSARPLPVPQQGSARQRSAGPGADHADHGERKVAHYRAAI